MKTKAITRIILPAIVIALCGFVLIRRQSKTSLEKAEVSRFLTGVNNALIKIDSTRLQTYPADKSNRIEMDSLISILRGRYKDTYEVVIPKLKLYILPDTSRINISLADSGAMVTIPVTIKSDYLKPKTSKLELYIQKSRENKYKIFRIDNRILTNDYIAYEDRAYIALETTLGKYQPITKKAFANAITLRTRYDSVLWFSHVQGKTYFYVVKGKWDISSASERTKDSLKKYKMGMTGPDLKEIIPANFDLIRSIGGTFPDLVEVEKDHKHGFYNLAGKIIVPVQYDQVFPVMNNDNKAALRMGHDLYWLKNDYTISGKINLNIRQIFAMLPPNRAFIPEKSAAGNITEFNSDFDDAAIAFSPSYLVDLNLTNNFTVYKNPLRKKMQVNFVYYRPNPGKSIKQTASTQSPDKNKGNWVQSILYSITEHFVGGRFEFYKSNNLVLIDEKRNQAYGQYLQNSYSAGEMGESSPYYCKDYSVRAINDSLVEVKASASTNISFYYNYDLIEMPMYHYIVLKNNKMVELKSDRLFAFTQYVKMDDRYLDGCYTYYTPKDNSPGKITQASHPSQDVLLYMKNEIYASYYYNFKDDVWNNVFYNNPSYAITKHINAKRVDNVDHLLTAIDKYNIQWIDKKLKSVPVTTSLASR